MSTDIRLPKSHVAVFPDRCVACGEPQPGETIRVGTNAIGWWTIAFWTFGKRFSVDVPACPACRRRMRIRIWRDRILMCGLAIVGVFVARWLLVAYHGPFKKWLMLGIGLVFVLPLLLWTTFFPPALDLTAYSDSVDYEFQSLEYAIEFAELNAEAIVDDDA